MERKNAQSEFLTLTESYRSIPAYDNKKRAEVSTRLRFIYDLLKRWETCPGCGGNCIYNDYLCEFVQCEECQKLEDAMASLDWLEEKKPRKKRVSSAYIIAMTFCTDVADMSDYRYHYGRTRIPVYAIASGYYCVTSGKNPNELELDWEHAKDQTIARMYNKVLWFAPTRTKRGV